MQMAVSAIKNKKIKLKQEAASIFSVSEATLHSQLRGIKPQSETRANSHTLTAIEEETLLKQVLNAGK